MPKTIDIGSTCEASDTFDGTELTTPLPEGVRSMDVIVKWNKAGTLLSLWGEFTMRNDTSSAVSIPLTKVPGNNVYGFDLGLVSGVPARFRNRRKTYARYTYGYQYPEVSPVAFRRFGNATFEIGSDDHVYGMVQTSQTYSVPSNTHITVSFDHIIYHA